MPSNTRERPYFWHDGQKSAKRMANAAEEGGSPAEMAVTQYIKAVRLYKSGGVWQLDLHNGSAIQSLAGQTVYIPTFRVGGMSVKDTDTNGVLVKFDTPESLAVIERFIFGIDRPYFPTRIYLTETTTATDINLWH